MFTPLAIYATLFFNAMTTICCTAMCMLLLWQDSRRGSNQLASLALACFSIYSATNFLFHFSYSFNISPRVSLNLTATTYGFSMFSLFAASVRLVRIERRVWLPFILIGLGLALILSTLIWTGAAFQNITLDVDHTTQFDYTTAGVVSFLTLLFYEIVGVVFVRQAANDRSSGLWPILIIMPVAAVLNALPNLQTWPFDAISFLIVGVCVAWLIMRENVFKPMRELNQKLAQTNEELEHANLIKSQFLANMSHELRTPLNSVIGYSDLIVSGIYGPLNEKQEDRLKKIGRNGRLLLALINDVLDLSKIEAGRMTLLREPIALSVLLDHVLKDLRPLAEERGLTLTCTYPSDLPLLLIDIQRAEQILRNLINNAIRFTDHGSVMIKANQEADEIIVQVCDTGEGIPVKQQPYIFSSTAVTLSASTTPESRQLGLTLTRHLVQLHGGRIWFASEGVPGKGTTFVVTFPIAPDAVPSLNKLSAQSRGTVLCIDDNTETLEVLQGMLESAGYQVDSALDDRAAWQRIRERTPDVILLDILMPGIDGWQVLRKLRVDAATVTVPVVVISGMDQRARAQQAGAVGSLSKPLRRADLLATVHMAQQRVSKNRSASL